LGGCGRAAGAASERYPFQPYRLARPVPADRCGDEERHHDDRLRPGGAAPGRAVAPCRHPPGGAAAPAADPDDQPGRPARRRTTGARVWRGRGDAQATGYHHHRRAGGQSAADPVYHPGHLPVSGAPASAGAAPPEYPGRFRECIAMKKPALIPFLSAALLVSACTLGPDYQRPDTIDTSQLRHQDGWQPVPERSWAASGSWWQAFDDETLAALIEQSQSANQTLAQAEARYRAADAQWRLTRGELVPEVGASVSASRGGGSDRSNSSQYDARLQIGWAPDLWGRVRRSIEADQAGLQASAADLAAARLAIQVAVAESYIRLRALDRQQAILHDTLAAFERSANLTRNQYGAGIVSRSDVIQAETQLQSVRTDMYDLQAARAREQNALAALLGVAPVDLVVAEQDGLPAIPTLPRSLPAVLIARRPDVVAAERQVAAANARIGVAQAAWLPDVTLDLWGGVQSGSFSRLFDAPARVWSLGPSLAQTMFDGGRREANRDIAVARYDEQAAFYRQ